jgi:uncharacterized membrane protein
MIQMQSRKPQKVGWLALHIRKRLLAGLALLLPTGFTLLILHFFFELTARMVVPAAKVLFGGLPESVLFLLSMITVITIVYGLGLITAHVVGRRMVSMAEHLVMQVPLLKTIYGVSKQIVDAFTTNQTLFSAVVLIEFPRRGLKSIGFVTGTCTDAEGVTWYKVLIPTAPNLTTGFLQLVPAQEIHFTDISVEDGLKMIVSGGILSPLHFGKSLNTRQNPV